jgi:hypothetical protein
MLFLYTEAGFYQNTNQNIIRGLFIHTDYEAFTRCFKECPCKARGVSSKQEIALVT